MTRWIAGSWGEPIYYDYGGNVYYEDDNVYVDGQEYCTAEQYAEQASTIAQSTPEVKEDQKVEWMPLGVFALTDQKKGDANMILQLSVSKEGIIAGTYFNELTDTTEPVDGMVDLKTQRAAWTIGSNKNTVLETGISNLTNDETPVLVHFGKDNTQTWLMVRLEEPKTEETKS